MNQTLNKRHENNTKHKQGLESIASLIGRPLAKLLQKNMLHIAKSPDYFEFNKSKIHTNLINHGNDHFEITLEFNQLVSISAQYNTQRIGNRNHLVYHIYAIVDSNSNDFETEFIHKHETKKLREAYSFANELLIQHKFLPASVWGKDVFCE